MFRRRSKDNGSPRVLAGLFADANLDEWPPPSSDASGDPWASFVEARRAFQAGDTAGAVATWEAIAARPDVESRHVLQAWRFLRAVGVRPGEVSHLALGTVAQVAMSRGHDVLAAYQDGSVRYENHSGAAIIVDEPTEAIARRAADLLDICQPIARGLGLWGSGDLPPVPAGHTRMLMLTPGGHRFGQGPDDLLREDRRGAAYLGAATALLAALVADR